MEGKNYTGDPDAAIAAWGSGTAGVDTPTIGELPTITLPFDEHDDGTDEVSAVQSHDGRNVAEDSTKTRLRLSLKKLANFIAWLMGLANGTRSFKGVVADGTGGVDVVGAPGRITASENVVAGGNVSAGGVVTSATATSKKVWIPGLSFVGRSGTMSYSTKGALICGATGQACCALSQYLRIGAPSAKITSIVGYWNASSSRTMELFQAPTAAAWASGTDTSLGSAASALVSGTVWSASLAGLSVVADANHTLWLDIELVTSHGFYGVLVTFEDAVI